MTTNHRFYYSPGIGQNDFKMSPPCGPHQNTTILYAYSTDIDYVTYSYAALNFNNYAYLYATMANVRFDTKVEEEIEFHKNYNSLNASLLAHQPDPKLGYGDTTTGSDVYNVLKKFLNNKQASICGAEIYIAVKRYPTDLDVSDIVAQLRANHIIVYIAVDTVSSGGGTSAAILYDTATKTNGLCLFATDYDLSEGFYYMTWMLEEPYQFIAHNYLVSGTGRIELPLFKSPTPAGHLERGRVAITVQNHSLDADFISVNYTIASTDGDIAYQYPGFQDKKLYGTQQTDYVIFNSSLTYRWTIDYKYNGGAQQVIQCRMYSNYYHDFVTLPNY
ncbi:hypothetical protein GCK72_003244 [Caenorhabditis remanei]|uniref:DUF7154 domain-containing protein n=1 Tax=Caenorhabditis remanei TaxID=31234 RepID=A0A6A5HTZ4_CAERE|nr:hypothetical protein GCK72_003244 [Caenorhabditis remanei]KAF1771418.1 hypothetical protein GCK72_003244 [Caenorhabditis remanei]